jgi:ABC-type glutathione transport system ATPase component
VSVLLAIDGVSKRYPGRLRSPGVTALEGVSLSVARGQCFGLVGESGSGKTTLTRLILQLEPPSAGRIVFDGKDLSAVDPPELRRLRARIQVVFQDPYASLNPRMMVRDIVEEPMIIHRAAMGLDARRRMARVGELLALVGLGPEHLYRYPHELSGGQRQRVGIARALAPSPELLLLDEPTSALDVSVQAQVLNVLADLQQRLHLTYLFISHDLGVIRTMCDEVALIHRGRIVEQAPTEELFRAPRSDYARLLLAAVPEPDPDRAMFSA